MAQAAESLEKKIVNPRVEIDTSPPFESVKEAVDRFGGGGGPWIPVHLLRLAANGGQQDSGALDLEKIEEQAVQLERDLILKEQETRCILKELEEAKNFVGCLRTTLTPEASSPVASPDVKLQNNMHLPGLMFVELNQAKLNLSRTSVDLALIQASVESLNQRMRTEKLLLERGSKIQLPNSEGLLCLEQNPRTPRSNLVLDQSLKMADNRCVSTTVCEELKHENFEAEQFKKMTEASRFEVIKAMTEIERTKNSIKMAEMRINAAKKMEEAAKAVEAIALAEGKVLVDSSKNSSNDFFHKADGITLSFKEYQSLIQKAQHTEDPCKTKFIDTNAIQRTNEVHHLDIPILEKFEEISNANAQPRQAERSHPMSQQSAISSNTFKFRNSHPAQRSPPILSENRSAKEQSTPRFTTTTSIGDILSRKVILQDDVISTRHVENHTERQHISLSEMLQEQSRLIMHSPKAAGDRRNVEKQYIVQRKKFGFIQIPLTTKQSKKKTHPMNVR